MEVGEMGFREVSLQYKLLGSVGVGGSFWC